MRKLVIFAGAICALAYPSLASAMTEPECKAAWTKADTNTDGFVTSTESPRHHASLRVAAKTIVDGRISQAVFLDHCKAGMFDNAVIEPGAPLTGSNSFTEGQASDRAIATGLTAVSALKKDDNGIWRGTASEGARTVNLAIDFKGNVVVGN